MRLIRIFAVITGAGLISVSSFAGRSPLEKPEYDTDLGDTSRDISVLDQSTNQWVFRDSEATATFDASTGRYDFRFKDEGGVWRDAHWNPRSNIDVILAANIDAIDTGELQYSYTFDVLQKSALQLDQITLDVLTDVADRGGLDKITGVERGRLWEAGEWVAQELSIDWGRRLWVWARFTGVLLEEDRRKSSVLRLVSKGLPTLLSCWVQGDGDNLYCEYDPAYSVSRFHGERQGILKDAAKGITVAPGLETVELPVLKRYFDTSISQGWLEDGDYCNELRALLDEALRQHESRDVDATLTTLKEIQALVDSVYQREHSPILSEAYALFHFNVVYLLEHYRDDVTKALATANTP